MLKSKMSQKKKYKVIAAFLLMVFSLNTLAGFACSIGIDMGYNSTHHKHEKKGHVKAHQDSGSKLSHESNPCHKDIPVPIKRESSKDCCANQVNSFAQLDKSLTQNNLLLQAPVFFIATVTKFCISYCETFELKRNIGFQFVRRSCSTYDTDIRIAIQSFQI
ncbi:MAG: hypothetical protein ABR503_12115 [Chitinophagaceae bacterium]